MAIDTFTEIILVTDPSTLIFYADVAAALDDIAGVMDADAAASVSAGATIAAIISLIQSAYYTQLANHYYNLYDGQKQFYYDNFQNTPNGEAGLVNQVFNSPLAGNGQGGAVYVPQYAQQSQNIADFTASGSFSSAQGGFSWWSTHAAMYYDGPLLTTLTGYGQPGFVNGEPAALDFSAIEADFDTYLFRYEEHRKDVYDERTWEWQNQSLNFGVKQASLAQSGLATSFPFLDMAMNNSADWFATQANGLSRSASYTDSLASNGGKLAASSQLGRSLAFSTHLGVDVGSSMGATTYPYGQDRNSGILPGHFENVQ